MNCTHSFCSDNPPNIQCRKCGARPICDERIHGRKQHNFFNGICIECGMHQLKIAIYDEVINNVLVMDTVLHSLEKNNES